MKKLLVAVLVALIAVNSIFACTIFAVGKNATVDGSTMASHTCDSTSDDLRLWIIPSMEVGTVRDIVLSSRAGADYSNFPAEKNYGPTSLVLGEITVDKPTNQYIHGMYSFLNDKGLSISESTCWYSGNNEQTKKLNEIFTRDEGIIDAYMLQDLALENCSTAREAVLYMGDIVETYGWNGANSAECFTICDGNEAWAMEFYGGNVWVAVRVPDDSIFVCANRSRINKFDFNDSKNYLCTTNLRQWTIDNGLWDGKGAFVPCRIFCPNPGSTYSTNREWMAMKLLNPDLKIDRLDPNHDYNWPMFVKPKQKVSVQTIYDICCNYYQGTELDLRNSYAAGPYGNPLYPGLTRSINCYRCTYLWISSINAKYPAEVRCLAYFGWGSPDSTYLTPIFGSQTSLPSFFETGTRAQYDPNSGFWASAEVQIMASQNYMNAIEDIRALRNPIMTEQFKTTAAIQDMASSMVKSGNSAGAISLLTMYANQTATDWFNTWKDLSRTLKAKYLFGNINTDGKNNRVPQASDWWKENVTGKNLQ